MQCPECKSERFAPMKLEPSLGALECSDCGGVVLDLVAYRLWRERHVHEAEATTPAAREPDANAQALLCARCERIMLRFRYTADTTHVLDVCSHCDNVWMQAGEWAFLKQHELHDQVSQIFTDPWQRGLRAERTRDVLTEQWDAKLGDALHEELAETREWIRRHPQRDSILAYLTSSDPYSV